MRLSFLLHHHQRVVLTPWGSISPSIYVAFSSLRATNYCGDVGPKYTATTIAFNPDELSTTMAYDYTLEHTSDHAPMFFTEGPIYTQATWGDQ